MQLSDALKAPIGRTDSEVLLSLVLGKDRSWIFAHQEYVLNDQEAAAWNNASERRMKGEPVAYIRGSQEFFGRNFMVNPSVLIPRPATEELVRVALEFLSHPEDRMLSTDSEIVALALKFKDADSIPMIVDIGTGSGCIGITIACECPDRKIIATDISEDALSVAKQNAQLQGVSDRMEFRTGDGFSVIDDLSVPFLIVSNPPYIPKNAVLQKDVVEFEPHVALFAGDRGLDVLSPLVKAAKENPLCVGIIMECREDQVAALHS